MIISTNENKALDKFNELKKATVLDKMGEGFEILKPLDYLKIDIINNHGEDKLLWKERINLFNDYEKNNNLNSLLEGADKPAIVQGGLYAYEDVLKGEPIGFTTGLDACSSGLQWLSVLSGDRTGCELTNVLNTGKRNDAYTELYNILMNLLGSESTLTRSQMKECIMTSLYGSTAIPKQLLGEGLQLETFYEVMGNTIPAAWGLNLFLIDAWNPEASVYNWTHADGFNVKMLVETVFQQTALFRNRPIDYSIKLNAPKEKGKALDPNVIHSYDGYALAELVRRCGYNTQQYDYVCRLVTGMFGDKFDTVDSRTKDYNLIKLWDYYKETGVISYKIIDFIDDSNFGLIKQDQGEDVIYELLSLIPHKPFEMINIHDEYKALPTYMNYVRAMYLRILYEQAVGNSLSHVVSSILGKKVNMVKKDNTIHKDILNSNYALS